MAPFSQLLVIARGREETDPPAKIPDPLTQKQLEQFENFGLRKESFEDYLDSENPPVRRFRALYTRSLQKVSSRAG